MYWTSVFSLRRGRQPFCIEGPNDSAWTKSFDNKPSHRVLPPGNWKLKLKIFRLFHANNNYVQVLCQNNVIIYKDGKTIWMYHNHYLPCTYNSKRCRYMCNCYYYDRAVPTHFSSRRHACAHVDNVSSSTNGHVAAHRVTGLIKRLRLEYSGGPHTWLCI